MTTAAAAHARSHHFAQQRSLSGNNVLNYQAQQPLLSQYEAEGGVVNVNINSYAATPRSRSPSRTRRISIAGTSVSSKEYSLYYIPPTSGRLSTLGAQHQNDIIVDFIGSGKYKENFHCNNSLKQIFSKRFIRNIYMGVSTEFLSFVMIQKDFQVDYHSGVV